MKKVLLLMAVCAGVLFGCKNESKRIDSPADKVAVDSLAAQPDIHTSENSLDWAGTYRGTTPCADCEGIKTVLELKEDDTYNLTMTYLGRPEVDDYKLQGAFQWNKAGSGISLKTDGEPIALKVGENQVWMLDGDGNVIEGDLADNFILKKINE